MPLHISLSLSAASSTTALFKFQMSPAVELCKKFSLPPSSPFLAQSTAQAYRLRHVAAATACRQPSFLPPSHETNRTASHMHIMCLMKCLTGWEFRFVLFIAAGVTPFVIVGIEFSKEIVRMFWGDPDIDLFMKFKELAQAYEVLSDPEKCEIYDQYGEDALKEGMGGGGAGMHDPFDIFQSFFGGSPFDCSISYTVIPSCVPFVALHLSSFPSINRRLYKSALGNVFEEDDWRPIEYCIMAKHFERQGKSPYAYHAVRRLGVERMMGWNVRWRECVLAMIRFKQPPVKSKNGWLLVGGLNPENVGNALSILSPDGVDVSSGIYGTSKRAVVYGAFSKGVSVKSSTTALTATDVRHFDLKEDPSFWKDHIVQVITRVRPLNSLEKSMHGYHRCERQDSAQRIT
ncbi:hypothetical protein Droror1_Dr00017516 [Drosera rotundifolia]